DGQNGELAQGYEYLPAPELPDPEVTKVSPNAGELVGGELIYIEGKNFAKGITVTIGGNPAEVINYYSPLKIRVKVPEADTPGKVDVIVTNLDGKSASLVEGYEYLTPPEELEPVITLLSTSSGEVPGGEIIYIEGENFQSGLQVMFGDKTAEVLNYYSPVKIRVKVPGADTSGTVDVAITNPNGKSGTLAGGYTYNAYIPGINSLSAISGQLVGGEIIYINGKNFAPEVEITFGSEIAQVMNYYDTTRIRVKVPAATTAGIVDVVATNPDGESGTLADGYEYLEAAQEAGPEIVKCSLSSNLSGAEITAANKNQIIYIHGNGFKSTSKVKIIDASGTEVIVNPLNVYDAKRIRVRIPASTASGAATIKIVNDTLESAGTGLTIN
ncbi:MAG: IPT/TIG domain-containing protein, partial [Cellulosilyticaceae bacterium]